MGYARLWLIIKRLVFHGMFRESNETGYNYFIIKTNEKAVSTFLGQCLAGERTDVV